MTEVKPHVVDKSKWPRGPWDHEPDRIDFRHAGLPCLMLRHPRQGHWCGYAAVPVGHPLYGQKFQDGAVDTIDAHAGINYSSACDGECVCHVPEAGESDDVWWFGFDCHNFRDLGPGVDGILRADGNSAWPMETYKDAPYVRRIVEKMAEQLAAITGTAPATASELPASVGTPGTPG
jgi:hypothetical protein